MTLSRLNLKTRTQKSLNMHRNNMDSHFVLETSIHSHSFYPHVKALWSREKDFVGGVCVQIASNREMGEQGELAQNHRHTYICMYLYIYLHYGYHYTQVSGLGFVYATSKALHRQTKTHTHYTFTFFSINFRCNLKLTRMV